MMKSTLNSEGIYAGCIHDVGDSTIEFCAKRGESDGVIVRPNVLLKVGSSVSPNDLAIGINMCVREQHSNWFRGIICNRQFDSTRRATH